MEFELFSEVSKAFRELLSQIYLVEFEQGLDKPAYVGSLESQIYLVEFERQITPSP